MGWSGNFHAVMGRAQACTQGRSGTSLSRTLRVLVFVIALCSAPEASSTNSTMTTTPSPSSCSLPCCPAGQRVQANAAALVGCSCNVGIRRWQVSPLVMTRATAIYAKQGSTKTLQVASAKYAAGSLCATVAALLTNLTELVE